jgi:hypothetical protein
MSNETTSTGGGGIAARNGTLAVPVATTPSVRVTETDRLKLPPSVAVGSTVMVVDNPSAADETTANALSDTHTGVCPAGITEPAGTFNAENEPLLPTGIPVIEFAILFTSVLFYVKRLYFNYT